MIERYGAKEFVILFPYKFLEQKTLEQEALTHAYEKLERLRIAFEAHPCPALDQDLRMTFSAGLTSYQANEPLEVTFKRADEALYQAKHSGRNQVCMWPLT
ncbi:hypothetical protein BFW38_06955 [Terasakiispira papahanaumokuakeensis]|uniref:diguanylate cyclase n=2 Tax=Terasakiispira papahanaumokuakeensis TaxID=197479 RepID=A0A1E2V926_9GAMM|nr:hypothetical protein BFW38_06955 [Terasakiispira papahanaumokuakeensis]